MSDSAVIDYLAHKDFDEAVAKALWRRWINWLTRKPNDLLPFSTVMQRITITGERSLGVQTVPLNHIVGSVGRAQDFDREFLPRNSRVEHRWLDIDRLYHVGVTLPPVELYKVGDVYFVVDGNHRISVARAQGQEFIDARVTEIDVPVHITRDMDVTEIGYCLT